MRKETKFILLLVCYSNMVVSIFARPATDFLPDRFRVERTQVRRATRCISESDLTKSLLALRSDRSGDELLDVKRSLVRSAKSSDDCRVQVIDALMTAMERPAESNGFGSVDSQTYSLWANGADLLVALQATEAIDLLIENLGLTDGLSATLGHYPAVGALISIGKPTIPKLEVVLSQNPEQFKRKFAVFCIASIGGRSAKNALAKALPNETDQCVKSFISVSLEMFRNKNYPNRIPPEKNGSWYSMIYCSTNKKKQE